MRFLALVPLIVVTLQGSAAGQTPPGALPTKKLETPTMPVLTLPIEVVSAKPSYFGQVHYQRAGLTPKEFRVAENPSMTGAVWKPFKPSGETKSVVNGRSVSAGDLNNLPLGIGTCSPNHGLVKAWIQFRTVNLNGQAFVSNIKGDSTCVPLPG